MLYIDIDTDNINLGVDVDGTLTKDKIGEEIFTLTISEIEKKFSECTPKEGIDVLFQNNFDIHIITGRQEMYKNVTTDWLDMYGIPYIDLNMFPDDFYILNGYSVPKYVELKLDIHIRKNVHFSLDDNEHVIDALNRHGISAYKVNDNFRDAFEKVFELNCNVKDNILEREYRKKISQSQISKFIVG